jgi:hypothetical protein
MDMSAQWKGLQRGGACKQRRFFCHCCPLESERVHHPNNHKCDRFCADRSDDDWFCYHHDITSDEMVEDMKKDILELQGKLSDSIELLEKPTKICKRCG